MVSNFKNMLLSLSLIAVFAAVTLASVYTVTKEPIAATQKTKKQNAIRDVLPAFERLGDVEKVAVETGDTLNVYKAYDENNRFAGAAVETVTHNGYAGDIRLMVGFDPDGNIINYSVLEQKETPGLGTKVVEWFKTDVKQQNIIGKNPAKNKLTVSKDGGEVDAITAATVSSRAFLHAVQMAYEAYAGNTGAPGHDGISGASQVDSAEVETTQMSDEKQLKPKL